MLCIPFPGFPSRNPLFTSLSTWVYGGGAAHSRTPAASPRQGHKPLRPLMFNKAILCYICSWSHVYSLVGGLVPGIKQCPEKFLGLSSPEPSCR